VRGIGMKKPFWIPLLAAFGSMAFLYLIGFIFDIPILAFKFFQNESVTNGFVMNTEIALLPIAVGFAIGLIVERIVKV
jgi:hypothetical protein